MLEEMQAHIDFLLEGAYDLHVHPAPSHVRRTIDDIELYQKAAEAKMGGVILKCHYEPTGARAQLVNRNFKQGGTIAIGSITLNWPVGGLNPYAVESACQMGAKYIWMPTRDALHSLKFGNMIGDFFSRPGICILDQQGKLLPAIGEILEIAREHKVPVATGHISLEEALALCHEGARMGNQMVLTHPDWSRTKVPVETQRELAGRGVWIEKIWLNIAENDVSAEEMFHSMREVGPEHILIGTDSGKDVTDQTKTPLPLPIDAYRDMLSRLIENGFSDEEIRLMCAKNPAQILSE